jgi:hypothetical protein
MPAMCVRLIPIDAFTLLRYCGGSDLQVLFRQQRNSFLSFFTYRADRGQTLEE